MNKFGLVFLFAVFCYALALDADEPLPADDSFASNYDYEFDSGKYSEDDSAEELGVRLPRATCDLLSFSIGGFSSGHAFCAAHCLALRKGFRGGRCRDGVCNCRK